MSVLPLNDILKTAVVRLHRSTTWRCVTGILLLLSLLLFLLYSSDRTDDAVFAVATAELNSARYVDGSISRAMESSDSER